MLYQLSYRGSCQRGAIKVCEQPMARGSIEGTQRSQEMKPNTHMRPERQRKRKCISRESNPGHIDGNDVFYH